MNNEQSERLKADISTIKTKRGKNRDELLNKIATRLNRVLILELEYYPKKVFCRDKLNEFFNIKKISLSSRKRIIKTIIEKMVLMGFIEETRTEKIAFQTRRHILRSEDFGSFKLMMNKNGFNEVIYYKFYQDKNGIPRRRKVGKSKLNGQPHDENGEPVEDWDISILRQTKTRERQGVYSYGNKSITFEQRPYTVKSYKLLTA